MLNYNNIDINAGWTAINIDPLIGYNIINVELLQQWYQCMVDWINSDPLIGYNIINVELEQYWYQCMVEWNQHWSVNRVEHNQCWIRAIVISMQRGLKWTLIR